MVRGTLSAMSITTNDLHSQLPNPLMRQGDSPQRIVSIDALRGFVMFTMIFVNDLAGADRNIVPDWMVHFSDRHKGGSGMTFVDLVFPAFLFIVGMSIPIALSSRLAKGEAVWKLLLHVIARTGSLLAIGILMVHAGSANAKAIGMSGAVWTVMMFCSAILAFCSVSAPRGIEVGSRTKSALRAITILLRLVGVAGLIWMALAFRGKRGDSIVSLSPPEIHPSWYGILGLIGWSYLVASIAFLIFRTNRFALAACIVFLLCLFAAEKQHWFDGFWLNHIVDIGGMLGSHPSIAVAGVLLGTILLTPNTAMPIARVRFTSLYTALLATGALATNYWWGISKNGATPPWCLWASAITAALWLGFYLIAGVLEWRFVSRPLAIAGENVLLAYLLSEMMEAVLNLLHLGNWYDQLNGPYLANAIARSAGCALFILLLTAAINRLGFRLKL